MTANAARGEVSVVLAGRPRRLCLTLGALAEIEAGLGLTGIGELARRMQAPTATDLLIVLAALLRGGGEGAPAGELETIPPGEAARALAAAFSAAV